MIEILAILGGSVLIFLVYTALRFVNFKKRLLSEFEQKGIPKDTADEAYYRAADFINSMNADGKSVSQIVDQVLIRYPELFE